MLYHICFFPIFVMYNMIHDSTLQLQHYHHYRLCSDYFHAYSEVSQKLETKDDAVDEVLKRIRDGEKRSD